jgi:hypothetical protein
MELHLDQQKLIELISQLPTHLGYTTYMPIERKICKLINESENINLLMIVTNDMIKQPFPTFDSDPYDSDSSFNSFVFDRRHKTFNDLYNNLVLCILTHARTYDLIIIVIRKLIKQGFDINAPLITQAKYSESRTLVHFICELNTKPFFNRPYQYHDLLSDIIDMGADLSICAHEKTSLEILCNNVDVEEMKLVIDKCIEKPQPIPIAKQLNTPNKNGDTPVNIWCKRKRSSWSAIKKFYIAGADLNIPNANGFTPILSWLSTWVANPDDDVHDPNDMFEYWDDQFDPDPIDPRKNIPLNEFIKWLHQTHISINMTIAVGSRNYDHLIDVARLFSQDTCDRLVSINPMLFKLLPEYRQTPHTANEFYNGPEYTPQMLKFISPKFQSVLVKHVRGSNTKPASRDSSN